MADGKLLFETKVDTKGVEQGMTQVSNIAKGTLAANVITASTKAMANLGKAAIEVGKNFETSMSQVAATMGITSEEIAAGSESFEMLKAKAKEMGATTKYTASEAAEGLNILAMAGLSAEEACASIGDVMALAGAGAMSLEQSATYVTGAVKGFADEMENAGMYADIMAKGATMANTDVAGLGEALSRASSNANAYNQSVESTTVALLRLAEQNVTGAEAATSLSRVMADLYTPTDKAEKALKKLGIATYDEQGNARDLNVVVDELNEKLSGMSDEQKLAYENTIFTTFGMKGFQKMTVSTTETVEKFKKGIAEVGGSAMQQFATQTDNLEGKMAILNSALEATGIAIYEVFEDSMKHSVESATDAVDKFHDAIENGALGDSLKRLAKAMSDLLDSAIDLGTVALPPLIDALTFLVDNVPMILGTLIGYKGALAAYEIATVAATVAQEGLNVAIMSNPIGLIAGAVGLAVGAITQMVADEKEAERELLSIVDSTKKANNEVSSLASSMGASLEEFKGKDEYIRKLATELKNLNSLDKLDESQKKRVVEITSILHAEYEDLNFVIDETTGKLAEECAGWDKLLEARMQQARYEAVSAMIEDSMKAQAEAEYELYANGEKLKDLKEQQAEVEQKLADAYNKTWEEECEFNAEINALNADLYEIEQQTKVYTDANTELEGSLATLKEETSTAEDYLGTLTEAENANADAANATAEATEGAADANGALAESSDEVIKAIQDEKANLEELVESQVASFEKIKEASALSKQEVLANLESNVEAMNNWAENMETLAARGIDDGLLAHLANMGVEGAAQVQEFVNMSGDELAKAGELWSQALSAENITNTLVDEYMTAGTNATQAWIDGAWQAVPEAEEVANGMVDSLMNSPDWDRLPTEVQEKIKAASEASSEVDMSPTANGMVESLINSPEWDRLPTEVQNKILAASEQMKEAGAEAGQNVGEGLADGMKTSTTDVVKPAAEDMGKEATDSVAEGAGCHSPSELTKETGDNIGQGLADGMKTSTTSAVIPAARQMGTDAVNAVKSTASRSEMVEIGNNMAQGMAEGIRNGTSEVVSAARSMAKAAADEAKANLKINSPSKVFEEIGAYCVAGFNEGLDSMSVQRSMGRNIQATLDNMVAGIDRGMEYSQTINVYSRAMTPDELARDIRLEAKYGWNPNLA